MAEKAKALVLDAWTVLAHYSPGSPGAAVVAFGLGGIGSSLTAAVNFTPCVISRRRALERGRPLELDPILDRPIAAAIAAVRHRPGPFG